MKRRYFPHSYKSLLHFDYPYYGEPNDGCRDEIGLLNWTRVGGIQFAGLEVPYQVEGAPKFGYRCLYSSNDPSSYLEALAEDYDFVNLNTRKTHEIECFINPTSFKDEGYIFRIMSNNDTASFVISCNATGKIVITSDGAEATELPVLNSIVSSVALTAGVYSHILVRICVGVIKLYINGVLRATGTLVNSITNVTSIRLGGGFVGYLDEFLWKTSYTTTEPTVPTTPYTGSMSFASVGGLGSGKHGAFVVSSANTMINTVATVSNIGSNKQFTVANVVNGVHGTFEVGDEVMLLLCGAGNNNGLYAFRTLTAVSGTSLTIDSAIIDEFDLANITLGSYTSSSAYTISVIKVPNYTSLTVESGGSIRPFNVTNTGCGHIVVFRCQGDCTITGNILTSTALGTAYNARNVRNDYLQMCHSLLPERFLTNSSGGVYAVVGGKLTITGRVGGFWDGTPKAGSIKTTGLATNGSTTNESGGAGYGGCAATTHSYRHYYYATTSGVGGGSCRQGGVLINPATIAIWGLGTGGCLYGESPAGGTQGITPGGQSDSRSNAYVSSGAGALGNSLLTGAGSSGGGLAGACVLLVCSTLSCDVSSICTGGQASTGGANTSGGQWSPGGGGTGMCYIACKKLV